MLQHLRDCKALFGKVLHPAIQHRLNQGLKKRKRQPVAQIEPAGPVGQARKCSKQEHTKQSFATVQHLQIMHRGRAFPRNGDAGTDILSSGHYIQTYLSSTSTEFNKKLPRAATTQAFPKDIAVLDNTSAPEYREGLVERAAERTCGDGHLMMAGVDLGEVVSQAIHLNDPGKSDSFLAGSLDDEKSGHNRSKTSMVKPHALHEVTRSTVRAKQRLREVFPIATASLYADAKRDPNPTIEKLLNLCQASWESSRPYCNAGFRRMQRVKSFHDKFFTHFRDMVYMGKGLQGLALAHGDWRRMRSGKGVSMQKQETHCCLRCIWTQGADQASEVAQSAGQICCRQ